MDCVSIRNSIHSKLDQDMSPVARLLVYVHRYQRKFLLGLGCVVVTTSVRLSAPAVLGHVIDELTKSITVPSLAHGPALCGR